MVASLCCHFLRLPHILLAFLSLLLVTTCAQAGSTNRTIDDEHGDSVTGARPTFSPAGGWKQGGTCQDCFVKLDPAQTFQGTWHDATHHPGDAESRMITAQFTGTAVYVYCIVANKVPGADTLTNLTFSIDGQQVGSYTHVPTDSTAFSYQVPVYVNRDLPNKAHTIVIQSVGDAKASLVLFDNIVYTFTEEDPPTPTPTPAPIPPTTSSPGPSSSSTPTARSEPSSLPQSSPASLNSKLTDLQISPTDTSDAQSYSSSTDAQSQAGTAGASIADSGDNELPVEVVVGGAVGGFVIIAIVVALLLYLRHRRRRPEITFTDPFAENRPGGRRTQILAPSTPRNRGAAAALLHSGSSTASYTYSPRPSVTTYASTPRPSVAPYARTPRPSVAAYANSPRPSVSTYPNTPRPSVTGSVFSTMGSSATNTPRVSQAYAGMRIDVESINNSRPPVACAGNPTSRRRRARSPRSR
ncbi:hypothetical protein C8Q80DRAFT_15800 [Daedaleopsis nitida]|nr:hypothetical protein C8Q80DRAFT_15800 [Daedaleopsis nitida]